MSADAKGQSESQVKSPLRVWPQRVRAMIDAKRLREQAASKQSIAAIWNKAVEARVTQKSPN